MWKEISHSAGRMIEKKGKGEKKRGKQAPDNGIHMRHRSMKSETLKGRSSARSLKANRPAYKNEGILNLPGGEGGRCPREITEIRGISGIKNRGEPAGLTRVFVFHGRTDDGWRKRRRKSWKGKNISRNAH